MKHISAILWKQCKDTLKNKTVLIQYIMFPVMTIIMENGVKMDGMPEHFFATLFAVMYIGMAPLVAMSSIIAEEKEKNTLRVLRMSNVKPMEYLSGVGIYVFTMCLIGALIIALTGGYRGVELVQFLAIMVVGILVSEFIGAGIGTVSKNQMMATSLMIPVMMIFSFIPMLSMFNASIKKIGKFTYTQQINSLLYSVGDLQIELQTILVLCCTIVIAFCLFVFAYKKCGLE